MSKLKAFNCVDNDLQEFCEPRLVYLKSDADKVIAKLEQEKDDLRYIIALLRKENSHHKYKRCLAMAKSYRTSAQYDMRFAAYKCSERYWKMSKRWLELADKFK